MVFIQGWVVAGVVRSEGCEVVGGLEEYGGWGGWEIVYGASGSDGHARGARSGRCGAETDG